MDIKELITKAKDPASAKDVISDLMNHRFTPQPDVDLALKAIDPKQHNIMDETIRKDKWVKIDSNDESNEENVINVMAGSDDNENKRGNMRREKVARIAVALQRKIINTSVSFVLGTPVTYEATATTDNEQLAVNALRKIIKSVKAKSFDRKVARAIFGFKECAEVWYTVEGDRQHNKYGFETKFKLRCKMISPANGYTLYPYFDETGDMVAFSYKYSVKSDDKTVDYFETYTSENQFRWQRGENGYELMEGFPKPNPIGKIPVVYGYQDYYETEDVNALIDRLELLLSNFADTNDYHASPKIFVTGTINGWSKKGESGAVIEGEDGATMQYVSWQNAPDSVKLEIETLLKLIYSITQTPDISFDTIKGLNVSGVALKLMFMDAHLKVQDKSEIFDDYFTRRANILLAFIGMMNNKVKSEAESLEVEPVITPYMITDDMETLEYWITANGNKAVISQEESVEKAGLTSDAKATMSKINEESDKANAFMIGEPTES